MESIRIQNLRSIEDSGVIPIKDINILVGQNSSGKSSFLRSFPLMRQSIIRNTRGPILWYDDSLVDFGSYEESYFRYGNKSNGIKFCFNFEISDYSLRGHRQYDIRIKRGTKYSIEIEMFEKNKVNYIKAISIEIFDQKVNIEAGQDGMIKEFLINGQSLLSSDIIFNLYKQEITGIIPSLLVLTRNDKKISNYFFWNKCKDRIKNIIGNRLKNEERITSFMGGIYIESKQSILSNLKNKSGIATWSKKIKDWNIETSEFIEINNLLLGHRMPLILRAIDDSLKLYFEDCRYIAPVRSKASRYYRRQDLSVTEVDAYGENMHMFLDNLNSKQRLDYQGFVREIFGFVPFTGSSLGHLTINIRNDDGEEFNLADLGFGYSQVLPIITKLWFAFSSISRKYEVWESRSKLITILIEQPELHLHPAMQAQLADAFIIAINKAKENGVALKLIIETHSAVIINRIGRRIIEKKILSENINVTLFDIDRGTKKSIVKPTSFNENGILLNWPLGFFEPKN